MRVLKSLPVVFLGVMLCTVRTAHAQTDETDTITAAVEDTVFTTVEPDADSVFAFDTLAAESSLAITDRTVPDTALQRLRRDEAFWYANMSFAKKKKEAAPQDLSFLERLFRQGWVRTLLWALIIGGFVVVVFLFLSKGNLSLFRKKPNAIHAAGAPVVEENIFTIAYDAQIRNAVQVGDRRLAIRLHFLQTLAVLTKKGLIRYKDDFTNSDYLLQLRPTSYYADFRKLTRHFEYAWYGKFRVSAEAYRAIETEFSSFKKGMGI